MQVGVAAVLVADGRVDVEAVDRRVRRHAAAVSTRRRAVRADVRSSRGSSTHGSGLRPGKQSQTVSLHLRRAAAVVVVVAVPSSRRRSRRGRRARQEREQRRPCACAPRYARTTRRWDFEDDVEREQARYEDGMARLDPEQLVRLGNAAYGAGLSPADARPARGGGRVARARGAPLARELGARDADLVGPADRRDQGGAARRRRDAAAATRRWALGLGCARGRVADRALRGDARAARARALGRGGGGSRATLCRVATTSRPRSPTRSPRSRAGDGARPARRVERVLELVRDARGLPGGRRRSRTRCSCCRRSRGSRGLGARARRSALLPV